MQSLLSRTIKICLPIQPVPRYMKRLLRQRGEETYKIIHDMLATKNKVCIFAEKQEQYET